MMSFCLHGKKHILFARTLNVKGHMTTWAVPF